MTLVPPNKASLQVILNLGLNPRIALSTDLDWRREFPLFYEFVDVLPAEGNSLVAQITEAKNFHLEYSVAGDESLSTEQGLDGDFFAA